MHMLESTVNLLDGLFFIAVILLTTFCILGSIVASLRAINRGEPSSESVQGKLVHDMQPVERPLADQVLSVDDDKSGWPEESAIWSLDASAHLSGKRKESRTRISNRC